MLNGEEYTRFRDYYIYPSVVGFFKPRPGGFVCAGSGTFASIGNVRGILTCAHVIDAIADSERVDLALFPVRGSANLMPLNAKQDCDFVKFGPTETEDGPDLGFLKLSTPFFSSINHLVSVKNLDRGRADAVASEEPGKYIVDVVTGVIAKWTPEIQANPFTVRALMNIGHLTTDRVVRDQHDLFRFKPDPDENFQRPESHKGTSGGALWRVYPKQNDNERTSYRLIGVAFYETGGPEDREIVCHGQLSIYARLFDAAREKWAEAREA